MTKLQQFKDLKRCEILEKSTVLHSNLGKTLYSCKMTEVNLFFGGGGWGDLNMCLKIIVFSKK